MNVYFSGYVDVHRRGQSKFRDFEPAHLGKDLLDSNTIEIIFDQEIFNDLKNLFVRVMKHGLHLCIISILFLKWWDQ
jgi:hypothetical protein